MYRDAHAKIRADPSQEKKQPRKGIVVKRYIQVVLLWSKVVASLILILEANDEHVIATLDCL